MRKSDVRERKARHPVSGWSPQKGRSRDLPTFTIEATEAGLPGGLPADIAVSTRLVADGQFAVRLGGGRPDASPAGKTEGFSVQLTDELERAASERRVRVSVVARASPGQSDVEFGVAYSTCDTGNSGWRRFRAGPHFESHVFEWDVPKMTQAFGDFVGILPPFQEEARLDVRKVQVEVIERGVEG